MVKQKFVYRPKNIPNCKKNNKLIGDHVNKVRYGYRIKDIQEAIDKAIVNNGIVILELNPIEQKNFPNEIRNLNLELTLWIGVETTLEQTEQNMRERGESEETIIERLAQMRKFIEDMENNPNITRCDNGPNNRDNAVADFINIIETAILSS